MKWLRIKHTLGIQLWHRLCSIHTHTQELFICLFICLFTLFYRCTGVKRTRRRFHFPRSASQRMVALDAVPPYIKMLIHFINIFYPGNVFDPDAHICWPYNVTALILARPSMRPLLCTPEEIPACKSIETKLAWKHTTFKSAKRNKACKDRVIMIIIVTW